ncbi:MAG: YlzJ-like family protein [Pelosinus sp.]|nr:YlzJ-like family protein [Pelosinus sp.]
MILWTAMPIEAVLDGIETSPVYIEAEYNGRRLLLENIAHNQYKIVRLISTDPAEYLCNDNQPGTIITYG